MCHSLCTLVDPDDVEPFLWRCMSQARAHGWEHALDGLADYRGYDRRPVRWMNMHGVGS